MAIENNQYKYDHTLLYRRALRPVINSLTGYKKNNKRQQK